MVGTANRGKSLKAAIVVGTAANVDVLPPCHFAFAIAHALTLHDFGLSVAMLRLLSRRRRVLHLLTLPLTLRRNPPPLPPARLYQET